MASAVASAPNLPSCALTARASVENAAPPLDVHAGAGHNDTVQAGAEIQTVAEAICAKPSTNIGQRIPLSLYGRGLG